MSSSPWLGLAGLLLLSTSLVQATIDTSLSSAHYEPTVAMLCPGKGEILKQFQNKFLTKSGKWETDYGVKATCKQEKIQILQYCKQVYPDKKIESVVESSKYQKIDRWCKSGNLKCKGPSRWVKPFRCIESVPSTTTEAPVPSTTTEAPVPSTTTEAPVTKVTKKDGKVEEDEYYYADDYLEEDEKDEKEEKEEEYYDDDDKDDDDVYEDDDDYYDDDDEDQLNRIDTDNKDETKKQNKLDDVHIDPYYTHYIPGDEHEQFTDALERLEDKHRDKMTKVMKEWTKIETKYESLAKNDKEHAEKLKQEMADQFEKRIQNLEDENQGEKDQLVAMHQQRVVSRINQRKEEAMKCYTSSLNDKPVNYPTVRECLEKLLRALHKDRHHTLAHYRELVEATPGKADLQREVTLQHLTDVDRIVNESLNLLDRFPDLRIKLLPLMEDFLIELRSKDDTPAPLFSMDRSQEEKILDGFKIRIQNKIQEQEEESKLEKKRRKEEYRRMKEGRKQDELLRTKKIDLPILEGELNPDDVYTEEKIPVFTEDRVVHSNAQTHALTLDQPEYSVSGLEVEESHLGYISLLGVSAVLVLVVVGVVFQRRKHTHIRSHQGFLEVPTYSSPEEKHLSTMQVNGYENPTYKYFEVSVA